MIVPSDEMEVIPEETVVMATKTSTHPDSSDEVWVEKDETLPDYTNEQLPFEKQIEELKHKITLLENARDGLKDTLDMSAIEKYKTKLIDYR